jgi:hypothetical protein
MLRLYSVLSHSLHSQLLTVSHYKKALNAIVHNWKLQILNYYSLQ